jgi:hypothetical protein
MFNYVVLVLILILHASFVSYKSHSLTRFYNLAINILATEF